ncbi:MAG: energy-coupling factor transporter transmembrane component T [Berryella intestinalis]|nr:energy-coupling factor transporter transmembrane component T [Berryella intestinalis]
MPDIPVLGNYRAGSSVIHRLDPRTKLLAALALIFITLAAQTFSALGALTLFVLACVLLAEIPIGDALKSIAPLSFFAVVTALINLFWTQGGAVLLQWGFVTISEHGVRTAAFFGYRMILLLMAMSLLTFTTANLDITEAFERVLKPLRLVGAPVHELSMMMGIALRFLPQFVFEAKTLYLAQISRGAAFSRGGGRGRANALGSIAVPLFTSAFRHAETLSNAMEARCYHGERGRTRLVPLAFGPADAVCAAALLVALACTVAANLLPW